MTQAAGIVRLRIAEGIRNWWRNRYVKTSEISFHKKVSLVKAATKRSRFRLKESRNTASYTVKTNRGPQPVTEMRDGAT